MKVFRWIACFPGAMFASFLVWSVALILFSRASYGPSAIELMLGLAPLALRTAIPAIVFVISGSVISPSNERGVAFGFFALSLLFSAGGLDVISFNRNPDTAFWVAAMIGVVLGSMIGLLISLRVQSWRRKRPNKAPEPTPGAVTPRATEGDLK
jgi:hypothetical protein